MAIRLTYPVKSHETEELRDLYEEFKLLHPDVYEEWRRIEAAGSIESPELLKHVHMSIREFLMTRCEWESNAALTGAFADFRRIIGREIFHS